MNSKEFLCHIKNEIESLDSVNAVRNMRGEGGFGGERYFASMAVDCKSSEKTSHVGIAFYKQSDGFCSPSYKVCFERTLNYMMKSKRSDADISSEVIGHVSQFLYFIDGD